MRITKIGEVTKEFINCPKEEKIAFIFLLFNSLLFGYGHSKKSRIFERLLHTTCAPTGRYLFGKYALKFLKYQTSADFQDLLISFFCGTSGVFIEVGASDGIRKSNCVFLEKIGWVGIAIEANPIYFDALQRNRNCLLVTKALVNQELANKILWIEYPTDLPSSGQVITEINENNNDGYNNSKVESISVDDFQEIFIKKFGISCTYLSIDIENLSKDILESFLCSKVNFDFISIEVNNEPNVRESIHDICHKAGYIEIYKNFTRNESIFVNADNAYRYFTDEFISKL